MLLGSFFIKPFFPPSSLGFAFALFAARSCSPVCLFVFVCADVLQGTDVDQMWASMNAPRGKDVTKEDVMSTFKVPRLQDLESDSVAQNAAATQPAPGGRGRGTGLEDALEVVRKSKGSHVLEQTRSNWSQFKKVKDIDQELDNYKKDKNRYTDRLAFLARSDIREWEAEQHAKNKSTR